MGEREELPGHVTAHQIIGSKTLVLYCGHCEGAFRLALPIPGNELLEALTRYGARHRVCVARGPVTV